MLAKKRGLVVAVIALIATAVLVFAPIAPYDSSRVAAKAFDAAIELLGVSDPVRAVCAAQIVRRDRGPLYTEADSTIFREVARQSRIKVFPLAACGSDSSTSVGEYVAIGATGEQAAIVWISDQTRRGVTIGYHRGFTFGASWHCNVRSRFGTWRVTDCKPASQS